MRRYHCSPNQASCIPLFPNINPNMKYLKCLKLQTKELQLFCKPFWSLQAFVFWGFYHENTVFVTDQSKRFTNRSYEIYRYHHSKKRLIGNSRGRNLKCIHLPTVKLFKQFYCLLLFTNKRHTFYRMGNTKQTNRIKTEIHINYCASLGIQCCYQAEVADKVIAFWSELTEVELCTRVTANSEKSSKFTYSFF